MSEIKVSVCCLTYNHEKYIRQCLDGIMMQKTTFPFEVIVHDDASTDGTASIVEEYAKKYPDIIKPIIQTENQYSKNVQISQTFIFPRIMGEYVAVCEGDDYWCDEQKLQKQVEFLDEHPNYSACVHNTRTVDSNGDFIRYFNKSDVEIDIQAEKIIQYGGSQFHTSSVIFREKYAMLPSAFVARGFGDYPRAIYLSVVGNVHYFPDVMSVYRLGTMGSWTERVMKNNHKVIEHLMEVNRMLEEIRTFLNGRYEILINNVILRNKVDILFRQGKYKKILRDRSFREECKRSICIGNKAYLMLIMNAYFPILGRVYQRIKRGRA